MFMWWILVAIVAAIGEVLTTGLFLATVAVAAVITAIVAIILPSFAVPIEVVMFAGLSLGGIAFIRPLLVHTLGIDSVSQLSGPVTQSHLIGRRAVATDRIDEHRGQVRIGEGEFWSARSFDASQSIPAGTPVEIMLVDKITVLVAPIHDLIHTDPTSDVDIDKGA